MWGVGGEVGEGNLGTLQYLLNFLVKKYIYFSPFSNEMEYSFNLYLVIHFYKCLLVLFLFF